MGFTVQFLLGTFLVLLCCSSIRSTQVKNEEETTEKTQIEKITEANLESNKPKTENSTENSVGSKLQKPEEIGRSIDIEKYVSKEFHNKNNVYTLPTSPDTEKYIDPDYDFHATTLKHHEHEEFNYESELTTPKSSIFDHRYKEAVESVDQKLEHIDDSHEVSAETDSKESVDLEKLYEETKKNDTKADLNYINFKNVVANDTGSKNSLRKNVVLESGTNLNFQSSYNHTTIDENDSGNNTIPKEDKKTESTTLSNVIAVKGELEKAESSTVKATLTTRKSLVLTKPPSSRNSSHISILSNKIETETVKAINPTDKPKGDKENSSESYTQKTPIDITKRGSVKYAHTISTEPTTVSNNIKKSEQLLQENQVIPVHVEAPPTAINSTTETPSTTTPETETRITYSIETRIKSVSVGTQPPTETTTDAQTTETTFLSDSTAPTTVTTENPETTEPLTTTEITITTENAVRTSKGLNFGENVSTIPTEVDVTTTEKMFETTTEEMVPTNSLPQMFSEKMFTTEKIAPKMFSAMGLTTTEKMFQATQETTERSEPTRMFSDVAQTTTATQETTEKIEPTNHTLKMFPDVAPTTTEKMFTATQETTERIEPTNHIPKMFSDVTPEKIPATTERITPTNSIAKMFSDVIPETTTELEPTVSTNRTNVPVFRNVPTEPSEPEITENFTITSDSYESSTGAPDDSSGKTAAIAISSIAAVCLIVIAGLLVFMRKRQKRFNYGQRCRPVSLDDYSMDNVSVYNSVRRKGMLRGSKRSYGNPAFEDPVTVTHPLNFPALGKFATNLEDIKAEFEEIPQITARTTELPEGCETKNRYANVIPLPETRVLLNLIDGYPTSDYINANYVTGPKNTKGYYIACQAPMQNTVDDFWRMIWEQQCKVVLMVTHLFENGVEKCVDYLPPSEVLDCHRLFGDFQVTLKKREVKDKYIISSLQLKNMVSNSWREVTHFWYMGWPEKGVPTEANSLIAFLIEARSYMKSSSMDRDVTNGNLANGGAKNEVNPVVVHCSPGTGRTGVVIACDIAIREFEQTRLVDVPRIVYKIRRDRASAVQTKEQYAFIYKVITLYATKLTGGALDSL
ncbi:mucin-3A isoform X2 [Tribolium castaneum]|uniref:mucin-3A isoform X2 n=1 Tax=Tribolium castaneum TaxID=7070 RepID=UPI00046C2846|nr:PREDICTED: mucin-3A isoform X2 [Tribolium castaneum]|eukprot:XP_008201096.1 PREDICTED: mucin-3A isoform X2 [Tribolium castaneum]